MNIFLKIGEIIFKAIAVILILLALFLEHFSNITQKTKKVCKIGTNKTNPKLHPLKQTQSF